MSDNSSVECRVWEYEGKEYTEPPAAMIINTIMKEVYSNVNSSTPVRKEYVLPENLRTKLYIESTSNCKFNSMMCPRNSRIDEK